MKADEKNCIQKATKKVRSHRIIYLYICIHVSIQYIYKCIHIYKGNNINIRRCSLTCCIKSIPNHFITRSIFLISHCPFKFILNVCTYIRTDIVRIIRTSTICTYRCPTSYVIVI